MVPVKAAYLNAEDAKDAEKRLNLDRRIDSLKRLRVSAKRTVDKGRMLIATNMY